LPFELRAIALVPGDRAALHRRIAERFDAMLAAGLVEELAELRRRHRLTPDSPSMRAVGYRQAWEHLEGRLDRAALRERGIAATRQLAKRQLTWLRALQVQAILDPQAPGADERLRSLIRRAAG
jgi:tRNA dimethylallyltransferase